MNDKRKILNSINKQRRVHTSLRNISPYELGFALRTDYFKLMDWAESAREVLAQLVKDPNNTLTGHKEEIIKALLLELPLE